MINETHVVLIGGKGESSRVLDTAYILKVDDGGNWINLPEMASARFGHVCGYTQGQERILIIK